MSYQTLIWDNEMPITIIKIKKHFKLYPKLLINFLNLIPNHRLNEIKEYIDGYNYESKRLKSK